MTRKRMLRSRMASVAFLLAVGVGGQAASHPVPQDLIFEQRVKAQEAIERVYYSHQLQATDPFEKAVPRALLEAKVTRYLKQSAALEQVWKTPVTGEMLRREWERIAANTRFRERLAEIEAALAHDPILIQECFVRPTLVDRLTRSFFESHEMDEAGARATSSRTVVEGPGKEAANFALRGMPIAEKNYEAWWRENEESFHPETVRVVANPGALPEASSPTTPSTGSPSLDSVCVAADSWDVSSLNVGLPIRNFHTAVWTGSLMLIWGGASGDGPGTGERYDPLSDTWTPISTSGAPSNRFSHSAVWTGTVMIIWGGQSYSGFKLDTGARYNPATDSWSAMSGASGLTPRVGHSAVWTGSEMIVFGGSQPPTGSRYKPATDSWTPITTPGWTAKFYHSAVWTGTHMLVWGGNEGAAATSFGGAYNPATNQWTTITNSGAPPAAQRHTAVWTGSKMIVWGGEVDDNSTTLASGGIYDFTSDSWTATSSLNAPSARVLHTAIWTGTEMIVWGGKPFSSTFVSVNSGGRFNPALNSWTATDQTAAPAPVGAHTAVWTGDRMVVWGNRIGGRYAPSTNSWTPVSFGNAPRPGTQGSVVWTGNQMIVWGGISESQAVTNAGYRYDPLVDGWTPVSLASSPSPRLDHAAAWTGSRMVIWGGRFSGTTGLADGGRYDPIADAWTGVSTSGAPSARFRHTGVWTGSRVIVWGGSDSTSIPLRSGARYDPVSDSWAPMADFVNGHTQHAAVWTGNSMIIWGGFREFTLNDGGRYDPPSNQWFTISTTNAPSSRTSFAAVWTGSRMLIWGGSLPPGQGTPLSGSGAAYDPVADLWTPLSDLAAPSPRAGFSTVWTGREMIVWGGWTGPNHTNSTDSGGRYDPASDSWLATSLQGAPTPRYGHVAAWTGTQMIIWGANVDGGPGIDGGRYGAGALDTVDHDGDGISACDGDCDDTRASVYPGAPEICDGLDNDCDSVRDEGFPDADGDGYAACGGDCNDANPNIHPGAVEFCNHVDEDCDGVADNGFDVDGDGFKTCDGDCNDTNAAIHPGATELCNGLDDNCNSVVDDASDGDRDGYNLCVDCNDANPAIHPGAPEPCNGIDDDCSGTADDPDVDGDGFSGCGGPDCNDSNAAIHPGAVEACNGVDDDCDLAVDEDFDTDGDGVTTCGGDCNDADPSAWDYPFEVMNLRPNGASSWVWDEQGTLVGPGVVYDVASGPILGHVLLSAGACLGSVSTPQYTDTQSVPPIGQGLWFLVLSKNSCLTGTYGTDSLGGDRPVSPCP